MEKGDYRKASLKRRDALTKEEIESKSRIIFEKLMAMEDYRNADNILIYASMRSEVITDDIILDALANGKKVFCPKVTEADRGLMEFVRIMTLEDLISGYFGIREPEIGEDSEIATILRNAPEDALDGPEASVEEYKGLVPQKTLVIVPGAAFDRENNRIGYGKGFYDRYLMDNPEYKTIALAFSCQITDEPLPVGDTDVKLKALLTED